MRDDKLAKFLEIVSYARKQVLRSRMLALNLLEDFIGRFGGIDLFCG